MGSIVSRPLSIRSLTLLFLLLLKLTLEQLLSV
jgi:hypothetical protein